MRLVKILATAIWVFGVALASAAYADPPSIVGRLNYLTGPVSFAPGEAPDQWGAAQLNRPITAGDRLWTDSNGFAEMRVGSVGVRMAPQTSMDVLSLDDRAFQLRVAQGNVHLRVRRLPSDRIIEVATPTGAVVIRQPGSYRINVDSSGDFAIVAVRGGGQAEVFTADASLLVRDNEEAEFSGSARPQLYAAAQLDEFDRWATDRDRRYDNIRSTRYVSAEMTGYEDLDYYGQWRTVGEYGNVWIPNSVGADWAPYRQGHWVWVSPWGWTWVDDQPWGFAPFHYGRWVHVNNYWAWAPGRLVERPVYSPALVAFIGGAGFSVGISSGPAIGWIPLGYREPYLPWYTASPTYVRNVNVTHVTNVTNINNVTNIRYVNRTVPNAVTVVSRETFVGARPVQREMVRVDNRRIAAATVTREAPVAQPARTSFARSESGSRPPAQVITREAVTVHKPTAPSRQIAVRDARDDQRAAKGSAKDDRRAPPVAATAAQLPPVRVIERRQRVSVPVEQAPRAEAKAGRQVTQAPRADAPEQKGQPQVVQERQRDLQTREGEQAREQQGERLREQKKQETDQQKAQAAQQAEQLEREKKQRAGQEQQRGQQERDQGQKAAQEQRNREEQQRAQQERERGQKGAQDRQREEQQRAQQERERGQKAAQDRQREEQQRAQQERERGQKAAQEQERERGQKAAQDRQREEQQRAQQERERGQKAAQEQERERGQKAAQDRQREEQQRAQQERERGQKAAQEQQQRAQQEQQQRAQQERERGQKAAQDQQRQREEQQKAQQERERQQGAALEQQRAAQKAAQEQQRQQQAAQQQQKAAQEQQRQQQAAQQQQKAAQEQQRQQQAAQQQKAAQEQQRQQQAAQQQQKAAQEQQRQQQAAQQQQKAAQEQQRAQQAAQAREQQRQQAAQQAPEKGKAARKDKDQPEGG